MTDTENNSHLDNEKISDKPESSADKEEKVEEIGGPSGPEPTRYGDWERKGRCIDF